MAKELIIHPSKCIGCSSCVLTCSITYHNEFSKSKSHISIQKNDFEGIFQICFKSTCLKCCKCGEVCPTDCLRVSNL
ncbi:MAG: 4Fe-4S ferredoxin iron-sulfur binding protein [Anaerosolibacter sp.]|jgi:Fe-S-cluster-containing dehydrogenase component|nr:4Fe-4S ferredoxin iron-sulfur binding protein [Anaerosolibacter sp.]